MEHNYELKQKILQEALKAVPFEGWQESIFFEATRALNLAEGYGYIAFPEGIIDLIDFFLSETDKQMLTVLENLDLPNMRIRDKIFTAVKTRLELNQDKKEVLKRLVKYFLNPIHTPKGLSFNWRTVDKMWYAAGDTSTDYNFYTKRTLLMGVYDSTLLYFLNDDSEDHQKTWEFLNHRIDNVLKLGNIKKVKQAVTDKLKKIPFLRLLVPADKE
jgi:ubiquinone biosynthesis protein COQ9